MIRLSDLDTCFEGVIPAVIATAGADAEPNISYLSHVVRVDDDHIALSNQFFGKTAENLRRNPCATILLVDGRTGAQFRLETLFAHSRTEGPLFDLVAAQLAASSAQVGMGLPMRLRGVDVFRVLSITATPTLAPDADAPPPAVELPGLARAVEAIGASPDVAAAYDAALDAATTLIGADAAMVLMRDHPRDALVAVLGRGYDQGGAGADVPFGEGVIGLAASMNHVMRVGDLGRVRRLSAAIEASREPEDRSRRIQLPGLAGALSQMAVPLRAGSGLVGVLFLESRRRLAFGQQEEAAAVILARLLATAVRLAEGRSAAPSRARGPAAPVPADNRVIRVRCHAYDDSVFVDDAYMIKGVAGRILAYLIQRHLTERRDEFTNREIRLAPALRLPGYRDNLETRLILLRRRLEEKSAPIRLVSAGRGRIRLVLEGRPELSGDILGDRPA